MTIHGCDRMDDDLTRKCDVHESRYDCPNALINSVRSGYGIIVRDGGSSVVEIAFCPWCGKRLPPIADIQPVHGEFLNTTGIKHL
jgi:hypothetical protein